MVFHYMNVLEFIHFTVDKHLGSFLVWGIYIECSYEHLSFLLLLFKYFDMGKLKCKGKGRRLKLDKCITVCNLFKLFTSLNLSSHL